MAALVIGYTNLATGRDERPVKTHRERKSISTEQTYSQDLPTLDACRQQLPELISDLERRYARLDPAPAVRGVMVKVKFNDFTQTTVEHADPAPNLEQFETLLNVGWARGARPRAPAGRRLPLGGRNRCPAALTVLISRLILGWIDEVRCPR